MPFNICLLPNVEPQQEIEFVNVVHFDLLCSALKFPAWLELSCASKA